MDKSRQFVIEKAGLLQLFRMKRAYTVKDPDGRLLYWVERKDYWPVLIPFFLVFFFGSVLGDIEGSPLQEVPSPVFFIPFIAAAFYISFKKNPFSFLDREDGRVLFTLFPVKEFLKTEYALKEKSGAPIGGIRQSGFIGGERTITDPAGIILLKAKSKFFSFSSITLCDRNGVNVAGTIRNTFLMKEFTATLYDGVAADERLVVGLLALVFDEQSGRKG